MRHRSGVTALALVALLPSTALGQDSKQDRIVEVLGADAAAQIESVVAEAVAAGAPADPLYDKALEGAAKRVPVARILPAIESYGVRLTEARELLGPTMEIPGLVAGADALQRGVPRDALSAVGRDAGERGAVALVVLGDLTEAGVPTDRALETVREALTRDQEPEALLHVPAAVRRLLRDGLPPDRAARDVTRLMRDGVSPRHIRDRPRGGDGAGPS